MAGLDLTPRSPAKNHDTKTIISKVQVNNKCDSMAGLQKRVLRLMASLFSKKSMRSIVYNILAG